MSEETPEAEEFHPYVRLLLARMKSNPDEFAYEENAKPIINESFFTEAEKAAVWAARREVVLGRSHEHLMQQILKSNEPDDYETLDGRRYQASERYAKGATAGQVLVTSQNGYTWTTADHDAYLAQKQAANQILGTKTNAQQSSLMQNQLGGLAQGQQAYSGRISAPTSMGLVPDNGNTSASTWGSTINKLLGR